MSDNVTRVEFRDKNKRPMRRILSFCVLTVVVLAAVCLILFRDAINVDGVRRFFTYFGTSGSSGFGTYTFDIHSGNVYGEFDESLALGTVGGLLLFDEHGNQVQNVQGSYANPALLTGRESVLLYDAGGSSLVTANRKSGKLLEIKDQVLLDADLADSGEMCYSRAESGYKSVLSVYNKEQKEIYKWYSATQYLPLCAVSEGGKYLTAVALGQQDGAFESKAVFFQTDSEQIQAELPLGNQMIWDIGFISKEELCAVGEQQLLFLHADGQLVGAYDWNDQYLKGYDLGGNDFVTLCINQYRAGNRYQIVTVDTEGQEIASVYIGKEVLDISACGGYVAVLTSENLTIYQKDLEIYHVKENDDMASGVLMRRDGSVILIGSGEAKLYLP